jgi:SAM-dependent methyltransferase
MVDKPTNWIAPYLTSDAYRAEGNTLYFTDGPDFSENWIRQQTESIERYEDNSYEADGTLGELFGGFVATSLDRDGIILDIGCGLHPILPHYVKDLQLQQFVGVEPLTVKVNRDFTCLAGVASEKIPLKAGCANAAMFSTSLDHIEDAKSAIQEVLRVLKPGAPLYFWLGVHDPSILAESKTFGVVHNHSRGIKKAARILLAPLEHAYLGYHMWKRGRDLRAGLPLDNAHVRYHTLATVDNELESYGLRVVRQTTVPGSASTFVEARSK